jgi:cytochrome c-type protein NapC
MKNIVYEEYKKTTHYSNLSGVRALCSDCHVPKEWTDKIAAKIRAAFTELPLHFIGALNTREKFEARRLDMAKRVWKYMEATDSRECRNCHEMDKMDLAKQPARARAQHESAQEEGETCIDCHKGLAHKPVHKELEKTTEEEADFILE